MHLIVRHVCFSLLLLHASMVHSAVAGNISPVPSSVFIHPAQAGGALDERILQGADLHYKGRLDEARQLFAQVVREDPVNLFALNQLGLISAKQERFEDAVGFFSKVVAISADNTFARLWLGVMRLQDGRKQEARGLFEQVLRIDGSNADACYFLGVMAAVDHDGAGAVAWFRKAQELGSDDPETHYRLAGAFLSMDMPMNARLEFERTLAINPRHTKAMHGLGWNLFNQGYPDHAVRLWERVLQINARDAEARSSLAKVMNDRAYAAYRNGDARLARSLWEQTLRYETDNKAARYYLQKLGR
ncbi:tetratricopeptide repeat protein [Desulfovibrio mangrovi]|uniref:tetratricopeptide repeat protein n=1 Tax=Desulfovibrio mangrovi TaxID=2976983 RepID=UPI0022454B8C|nr:tetratricopeptide repeat protein [Desulfovibrio mangrovi]UZP68574.1 tetratricopeptide repeat protein [Desulfovibrio mangrovi]